MFFLNYFKIPTGRNSGEGHLKNIYTIDYNVTGAVTLQKRIRL